MWYINKCMTDEEICEAAIEFAKRNKKGIAQEFTDIKVYKPHLNPISVFMAGSPGAGKTELSKNLIEIFAKRTERRVIRIDADDLRPRIPGYTGRNSALVQGAASLIVEKIHDLALKQNQTFIFDGTFSHYDKAIENIERSLKKQRTVFVFYVYQKPEIAWKFTQAREAQEGRNVPKSAFVKQFCGARETVMKIREHYSDDKVLVFLVKKDYEHNITEDIVEIESEGPQLDEYIQECYTREVLERL